MCLPKSVRVSALAVLTLLCLASGATAQVVLNPTANPVEAPPVIANITVTGTGFPSGTIRAADVSVTIAPPPGNGSPVSVTPLSVTGASSARTVIFRIPASLTTATPIPNCAVTISGSTTTGTHFSSTNSARLTVNPPARVSNVSPGAGARGTSVSVSIAGLYSSFTPNVTAVSAGAGITVSKVVVSSKTLLTATFTIGPSATAGSRNVTVTTGAEVAALNGGFLVSANPGLSFSTITPRSGAQGQTLNVALVGQETHFATGQTLANFGDGIRVNSVTVGDSTHAVVNITIDPLADRNDLPPISSWRMVTLVTGGEFAVAAQGFQVRRSEAALTAVSPGSGTLRKAGLR